MWLIFKAGMLISQPKAKILDEKILFGKSGIFRTQKLVQNVKYMGTRILHSILVHHLLAIQIEILSQKMTIVLNLNFNGR